MVGVGQLVTSRDDAGGCAKRHLLGRRLVSPPMFGAGRRGAPEPGLMGSIGVWPDGSGLPRACWWLRLRVCALASLLVVVCLLLRVSVASAAPVFTPVSGSPFATGPDPRSVAFSPSGRLLATADGYASVLDHGAVSMFSVRSGGAVTPVSGSPFATGDGPESVAFSPSGRLLATANLFDSTVSLFSVVSDGSLTPLTGSPLATGSAPDSVAFSPQGGLLAVANRGSLIQPDKSVSMFSVGPHGALTPVSGSPFATSGTNYSAAFSPSGRLLATANAEDRTVSMFWVRSHGALTPVTGSPFATSGFPMSVAFSPSGRLLASANGGANSVSVFSVRWDGGLTPVTGSPFATGGDANSVAFSPSRRLLATANYYDATLSVFSVRSDGSLTPVIGSPLATGEGPNSVAFSQSGLLANTNTLDPATGQPANSVSVFNYGR